MSAHPHDDAKEGWPQSGRKRLILPSPIGTIGTGAPDIEPELFAEMQARGLIKRIAWRDPTGLCPMVMEMRHRQQHFPALYYMPASSEPPATASAPSAISMPAIVGQLLGLIPAW